MSHAALARPKPKRDDATDPYFASTSSCTFSIDLKYLTVFTRSSFVASSLQTSHNQHLFVSHAV